MREFSARHPLLFGALVFFAALVASVPIMLVLQGGSLSTEVASAIARLVVGVALIVLFRTWFHWDCTGTGLGLALPALAFVAWNLVYNLMSGCLFVSPSLLPAAVVCGLAPGVMEEVIFRGITIDALRRSGRNDLKATILSALLFSLVHLTNAVGMDVTSVLVQVCYSLSIGLVLGAIYVKSNDIVAVMAIHAAIDISSQIFASHPTSTSMPLLVAFFVLIVVEAVYALTLVRKPAEA